MIPLIQNKVTQFLFDSPTIKVASSLFGNHKDVMTLREIGFMESEKLSDEPFDLVPLNRVSCLAAGGDPKP